MRVPYTITKNVFETYRCSQQSVLLPYERDRSLRPEDESWDKNIVPELKVLAINVLVEQWQTRPILDDLPTPVDRDLLLELLPTDLPFDLMIRWIPDEFFWQRASKDRWEYNCPDDHGGSWRQLYVERHFSEYLEKLSASLFKGQEEFFTDLIDLCKDNVFTLKLRSLIPSSLSTDKMAQPTSTEDSPDHIPFNEIIPRLPNLTGMYINFGLIYMNAGFEWRDFKFSVEDCRRLGQGIKNSERLARFSLTRSDLDSHRVAALLHGMAVNNTVVEMDLSHCKLGDVGAQAVGEYLTMNKRLKVLHLANNYIGETGVQGIVYGLLQESATPLKSLNLRLNPIADAGAVHICSLLLRNHTLESLNISGCSLTTEGGINIAECMASGYLKFSILHLDVSNNELGQIAGEAFEIAATSCNIITGLEVRMCNFSKKSESTINETVARNREFHRQNRPRLISGRMSTSSAYQRGVSLTVPLAYSAMQIPPVLPVPGRSLRIGRPHSRINSGSRSGDNSRTASWRFSRTSTASKLKVESSTKTVSDPRESVTNDESMTTGPSSTTAIAEPQ